MALKKRIDPIAQLMQEHDEALLKLSSLRKASQSIAERGFTEEAFDDVLSALEFIEEEVSVHNKSEEDALFPVLERYVEGPTKLMRQEHKEMKKEFRKLRSVVIKVGKNRGDRDADRELHDTSRVIIQRFVNHIHKENHILFPLVQKFLTKDALREVARRML
jgi:hemerythrin-like domain-containing protein